MKTYTFKNRPALTSSFDLSPEVLSEYELTGNIAAALTVLKREQDKAITAAK